MDFLRMEGEMNFFALLPRETRQGVHDRWYRGAKQDGLDPPLGHRRLLPA